MSVSRKEILDLTNNIDIKELDGRHISVLSWIIANSLILDQINFDPEINSYKLSPRDVMTIDSVCHTLYEFTDMNNDHVIEIKNNIAGIMAWRSKISTGAILGDLFITSSYGNSQDVVVNLGKYLDATAINNFGSLVSADTKCIKTLIELVKLYVADNNTPEGGENA